MHVLDARRAGGREREREIELHIFVFISGLDIEFTLQLIDNRDVNVSERTCGGKERKRGKEKQMIQVEGERKAR
jgi:hypothetical protein